jgi:nucleoside-diphosphate-sugar epimerase
MSANALTVAELAKELNARLVFVSSSMVYGNFTQNQLCESQPRNPVELPGILKSHCEDITKFSCKNTVIVRPSAVYGPGDHSKHIFNKWIVAAFDNKPILIENPSPQFDFTHIDDVVKGIKIIEENGQAGEAYNLSYGQVYSLSDAFLLIKKITGSKSEVELLEYNLGNADSFPKSGSLNISKAHELGYRPKMDLLSGLKNYLDWIERYSHLN